MNRKGKNGVIIRTIISVIVIGLLILGFYLVFKALGYTNLTKEELRDLIDSAKALGPIVYIFISFLQVTFIPVPGMVTILSGNLLFGPWEALLYSFIGMLLGSLFAFYLGRVIGRSFVNWVVGDKNTVDEYLKRAKGKEIVLFFFMFLLPMFPDDALCALAGITPITWPVFILMQVITRPISILGTIFFMSGEIIPFKGWGLVVIGLVGILSIIAFIISYKNSEKINSYLNKIATKITNIFNKKEK